MKSNPASATSVDEIAEGIYRIHTPIPTSAVPGGFSFNQYLVVDDEPLLFHTGPRRLFSDVRDAVATVLPIEKLRWLAVSHLEADECGALNALLAAAPHATPVAGVIAARVSLDDMADRAPRALTHGEALPLGKRQLTWLDAPHVPHGWDCGYMFDERTRTLLCGDLFTQPGADTPPLTEGDILGPSEAMRRPFDYFAHAEATRPILERLASVRPETLACMHGSAWRGDGAALLRALGDALAGQMQ